MVNHTPASNTSTTFISNNRTSKGKVTKKNTEKKTMIISEETRRFWEAIQQIEQKGIDLHNLYYRKISIYRSQYELKQQRKMRDELTCYFEDLLSQQTPGFVTFKQKMNTLLYQFACIYLNLADYSNEQLEQNNAQLDRLIQELNDQGLSNCNLMALCYNTRGIISYYKNMIELSVEEYTQALKICPSFTVAYNNRAVSYQRLGKYDLALSDDTKAIELNPNYAPAFNNRGNTYFYQSDWTNAIADYTKTIALDEFHPEAYFNRALVYQLMGEEVLALKDAYLVTELKNNYGFVEELYKILRKRVHTKCCDPLTTIC